MLEQYINNPYLRALVILVGLFVILKLIVFVTEKIILKIVAKTKTDIDDKIIAKTSKPFSILIFLVGFFIAIKEIPFSENLHKVIAEVIFSIIVLVVGYVVYFILDLIIARGWKRFAIRTKSRIDESLSSLVHNMLRIVWLVITFLYLLDLWGVQIGPFLAGLGIAGLAVALALQPVLSNIFSGISIVLDKTVRVGDLVYLDSSTKGTIKKVGIRSTKIQTFDNELIIIPNNKLADGLIQNVALPEPKTRVVIPFSVAYGSNIDKVKKIVLNEVKSINGIVPDEESYVRFVEMANSSLNFKAYFYVGSYGDRFAAIDEANTKIYNALNKNKINIPFPQMDVHLKK